MTIMQKELQNNYKNSYCYRGSIRIGKIEYLNNDEYKRDDIVEKIMKVMDEVERYEICLNIRKIILLSMLKIILILNDHIVVNFNIQTDFATNIF